MFRIVPILAACACLAGLHGQASQLPGTLPFQGRLTLHGGGNANGSFPMTFRIYAVATSGNPEWTEVHAAVAANNGVFQVDLGSVTGFPPTLFDGRKLFLGVQVQ